MASRPDEEAGEIRPAPFELEPEPTPAPRGRKPAAWRASSWTGGAASVALILLSRAGRRPPRGGAARGAVATRSALRGRAARRGPALDAHGG